MKSVILNKKKYPGSEFVQRVTEEYCNLEIYPLINGLDVEAGILSELGREYVLYGDPDKGSNMYVQDNISLTGNNVVARVDPGYCIDLTDIDGLICCKDESIHLDHEVPLGGDRVLHLTAELFELYTQKFPDGYSNLICLCMIVKDAGPTLEEVLTENLNIIDTWCILDTGSTDGTQDVIKRVLKNKRGALYEEPFVNFKVSRNRCLELAGTNCKFLIMLDDTYSVRGDLRGFLESVRGDQFSDSFSLLIQSDDSEYYSNRIIKSRSGLRYVHTIHEVISDKNNNNVTIPSTNAFIYDHRSEYMEKRTTDRKQFDLELLFKELEDNPSDPRSLYYIAQTYGCLGDEENKAKYFLKRIEHPEQGYIQEKVDACFELARTYNFKLNRDFSECEKYYLLAWSLDKRRPDSLYFIGIKYYLEHDYALAYTYFKQAFEIGYPINSQYSLKPTLSFHFLPKFLTEVCFYQKDYLTGMKSAQLFLGSQKYNVPGSDSWDLVSSWYGIHYNMNLLGPVSQSPIVRDRKIFCIVSDGGWDKWTGKDILTKGVGGSETWVIEMARHIKRNTEYDVVVFCRTSEPEYFEDVGYNPIEMFHKFVAEYAVEHCIVSRYTEYVPVALCSNCKNVGIIFHDLLAPETIIPVHPKLKWVFGLTDWHCGHIASIFPVFKDRIHCLGYGIDLDLFVPMEKVKNSFIYSSFPNRGLSVLLKMWPRILAKMPGAVLNVYSDINGKWANKVAPEEMRQIAELINQPGVNYHSWVSKRDLAKAWGTAEYWLYPCTFSETFCLTAFEAAATRTMAVTNNRAALGDTVGDRGLVVHGDPHTQEWQDECISRLALNADLVDKNYRFVKKRDWASACNKLLDIQFVKYYSKNTRVNDYLVKLVKTCKTIVDIGCGASPFEPATLTVDYDSKADIVLDIENEPFPFDNADFIYCRHVIEDLRNPEPVIREIIYKSRNGYIETPSIMAECCKKIDAGEYPGCGYAHHSSMVWTENGVLMILPKYPFLEHLSFSVREILEDPLQWNNYHMWDPENPLRYKLLRYTIDFNFRDTSYIDLINRGIKCTISNNARLNTLLDQY